MYKWIHDILVLTTYAINPSLNKHMQLGYPRVMHSDSLHPALDEKKWTASHLGNLGLAEIDA